MDGRPAGVTVATDCPGMYRTNEILSVEVEKYRIFKRLQYFFETIK